LVDLENISHPGDSPLLEIPVTILPITNLNNNSLLRNAVSWFRPSIRHGGPNREKTKHLLWLRPRKGNLNDLILIVKQATLEKRSYIELMLHSSELMPGGSPTFPTEKDIELLYHDLEILFETVKENFVGVTLKEYYQKFLNYTISLSESTPRHA